MLEIEKFPPPADFREHAEWADPAIYEEAAADPVAWWTARSKELLDWDVEPTEGLNDSNPPFYKWFEDGRINASAQCLDRHVAAGIGDRVAYHWRGEEGERRDVTYAELLDQTQRFANALKDLGVEKGDVVGIYLPMIPEVAVAMLACARIGAIHNVVFGGFSRRVGAASGWSSPRRRRWSPSTAPAARARRRRSRRRSTRRWGTWRASRRSSSSARPGSSAR